MKNDPPWYATAFDADYPIMQTYENSWTAVQAMAVETLLGLPGRARILDLGCGYGRHTKLWAECGHLAIGFDLSAPLLAQAKTILPQGRWVRGDHRALPFQANRFDAAVFMFVSFGYLETRADDLASLREVRRILRPGGGVFAEIKNPAFLRENVPPTERFSIGEAVITESSRIVTAPGGERYEIRRELDRPGMPKKNYHYSVRLYGSDEMQSLLSEAGFSNAAVYGDYDGSPLTDDHHRLIALGTKPG